MPRTKPWRSMNNVAGQVFQLTNCVSFALASSGSPQSNTGNSSPYFFTKARKREGSFNLLGLFERKRHNFHSLAAKFAVHFSQKRSFVVTVRAPTARDLDHHDFAAEARVSIGYETPIQVRES